MPHQFIPDASDSRLKTKYLSDLCASVVNIPDFRLPTQD
jgi:hypothetical protein